MSKPTMQDIADALSVSRITVWKALSNRPGVSDSMRAQIHQKATEMGYFHTPSQDTTATVSAQLPPHTRTVAVAVCRPESSLFWMQIIHQIAKDLSEHNVNLMLQSGLCVAGAFDKRYSRWCHCTEHVLCALAAAVILFTYTKGFSGHGSFCPL